IGILTTAQKRKKIEENHIDAAIEAMCTLNKIGGEISALEGVVALTDITGFGLMGHLGEICEGSGISATLHYDQIPFLPNTHKYYEMDCIPGGTRNNFRSYGHTLGPMTPEQEVLLCDAQTSGGLLCVVKKENSPQFKDFMKSKGFDLSPIGYTHTQGDKLIYVENNK
ncbi:MAG: selenide, water dikinase SelD, partial [Vallitaleaceae bacterium]|nr:selenide, water dikinase SelD [Vallitaleaceae bacterium]